MATIDLPADAKLEGLNAEVAAILTHDIVTALQLVAPDQHRQVARELIKRLVLAETQLLTWAIGEALAKIVQTQQVQAALGDLRAGRAMVAPRHVQQRRGS